MITKPRRGVLLLVVLALLAMFAMLAVAFVVLTGSEKRTADRVQRIEAVLDQPDKTLQQGFNVIARGTAVSSSTPAWPTSAVMSHSLLEGIDGSDLYRGQMTTDPTQVLTGPMTNPNQVPAGQLIEFSVPDAWHKVGCVLTMTSGACAGQSTRIVGIDPPPDPLQQLSSASPKAQILPFENGAIPIRGDNYIINGVPYGGMGYGFNTTSGSLDQVDSTNGNPLAFLPNDPANFDPPGGANADYTAPDHQTPLLALQVPINGMLYTASPSLHRPELMAYWAKKYNITGGTTQQGWSNWVFGGLPPQPPQPLTPQQLNRATLLRQISFRPNPVDHPVFYASVNPTFNPVWDGFSPPPPGAGPWQLDVDNDGDGIPDSIWVDLGLPVRYTTDGRAYKPLFAILCVDLDGRLNVNAHGTLAQAGTNAATAINTKAMNPPYLTSSDTTQGYMFGPVTPLKEVAFLPPNGPPVVSPVFAGNPGQTATLPRGLGYGPPEINLRPLFGAAGSTNDLRLYQSLLVGNNPVNGRYGEVTGTPLPGFANWQWPFTYNKWWDYSGAYWGSLTPSDTGRWRDTGNNPVSDGYLTPPDPQGFGAIGLDLAGRPIFCSMGGSLHNTPYDLDLSRNAAYADTAQASPPYGVADTPYGASELERILRPFDRDVGQLPSRLAALTSISGDPRTSVLIPKRYAVTTQSSAVPTPSIVPPPTLLHAVTQAGFSNDHTHHVVDLLTAYLLNQAKLSNPPQNLTAADIWTALATILPAEMYAGNKLNLNRPLSNWPATRNLPVRGFELFTKPGAAPDWRQTAANQFNLNPSGGNDTTLRQQMSPIQARQLFARYLYVLALLVRNPGSDMMFYTEAAIPPPTDPARELLNRRRLAQWAINAACFATPDSVMVPFKYNVNPFTKAGWTAPLLDPYSSNSKGLANARIELSNPTADSSTPPLPCGVVWGCKPPECLITETAAFHNRRVVDSAADNGSHKKRTDSKQQNKQTVPGDIDLDQARIPQGSFFFELYCPRSAIGSTAPGDLYKFDSNRKTWTLDLGLLAPSGTNGFAYPVWRAVITESRFSNPNDDILTAIGKNPDTFSFETEQTHNPPTPAGASSILPGSTNPNVTIERIVWFSSQTKPDPSKCFDTDRIYYNQLGTPVLLPADQYAVVGPRPTTYISAAIGGGESGTPATESIVITGDITTTVPVFTSSGGTKVAATAIKPVLGIVVAGGGPGTTYPKGWSPNSPAAPHGIGLSISEPLFSDPFYYPEPTKAVNGITEWYNGGFLDRPLEPTSVRIGGVNWTDDPNDSNGKKRSRPIVKENIVQTATTPHYKYIFLQRLANPLAPFDPVVNPYRTVDWMPIDLTVYNGDDKPPQWPPAGMPPKGEIGNKSWAGPWDPDDPNNDDPTKVYFQSRQRGKTTTPIAPNPASPPDAHYQGGIQFNLWAQTSDEPLPPFPTSIVGNDKNANFNCDLRNNLGYINQAFWDGNPVRPHPWVNSGDVASNAYIGSPWQPFPWLTWNGRPYVSELELLNVPASHPGRLLWEFNYVSTTAPSDYSVPTTAQQVAYPHLLNFFQSSGTASQTPTQIHRLLEYVGVPSRFTGTDLQIDPGNAAVNPTNPPANWWFHTPFNRIPLMREPGRMNVNTITNLEEFQGLMDYYPGMAGDTFYDKFVRSRRGGSNLQVSTSSTSTTQYTMIKIDPTVPTRFLQPFRSAAGAALGPGVMVPPREIEAGLLRSDPDPRSTVASDPTGNNSSPLFEFDRTVFDLAGLPTSSRPIMDSYRNAFFRHQSLQRLGNLVTTRSNVFAIWITVGYFEVLPNRFSRPQQGLPDAGHPDGYELGQELGSDTGDIVRHRAFYIFDRSIPVGFIRGQDINHDKAVLLKRYIE